MNKKELLKTIIVDYQSAKLPKIWQRTLRIPVDSGKIITLAGVRRSGKTYHIFNLIKQLKKRGMPDRQVLYLNFEDERLKLTTEEIDLILQAYRELYPNMNLAACYFFFDEIQELAGWEKFIARLYNSVSKHIFITGSNATLLSREIATALRGRTITFEVYPLSFREFVQILKPGLDPYRSQDKARMVSLFEQFLQQGGFPELIGKDEQLQNKILQEYFNVMVLRDLIERYHISQAAILKYFCKRTVAGTGGEFSTHKIYNELKSQGYKVSKDTVYAWEDYVDAIYLARFVPKYATSIVKTALAQKKIYVIDQGLGVSLDFKLAQDKGRLLETIVALELVKQGEQIAWVGNGSECDFVVIEKGEVRRPVQVAWELNEEQTKNRELKGLIQTCQKFNLPNGTLITFNESQELKNKGIAIKIIPAWQYFLQPIQTSS